MGILIPKNDFKSSIIFGTKPSVISQGMDKEYLGVLFGVLHWIVSHRSSTLWISWFPNMISNLIRSVNWGTWQILYFRNLFSFYSVEFTVLLPYTTVHMHHCMAEDGIVLLRHSGWWQMPILHLLCQNVGL